MFCCAAVLLSLVCSGCTTGNTAALAGNRFGYAVSLYSDGCCAHACLGKVRAPQSPCLSVPKPLLSSRKSDGDRGSNGHSFIEDDPVFIVAHLTPVSLWLVRIPDNSTDECNE